MVSSLEVFRGGSRLDPVGERHPRGAITSPADGNHIELMASRPRAIRESPVGFHAPMTTQDPITKPDTTAAVNIAHRRAQIHRHSVATAVATATASTGLQSAGEKSIRSCGFHDWKRFSGCWSQSWDAEVSPMPMTQERRSQRTDPATRRVSSERP